MTTTDKRIMSIDPAMWDKVVTVELTVAEAHYARAACRYEAKKRERRAATSGFVPEPGRVDSNKLRARVLAAAATKLARGVQSVVGHMQEEPELS